MRHDHPSEYLALLERLGERTALAVKIDRQPLRLARARIRRERLFARQRVEELARVDPKVQAEEAREEERYHSVAVIDGLLRRAQAEVLHDPQITRTLARSALAIVEAMFPSPRVPLGALRDLAALGHAQLGNVSRLLCEWEEAEQRFGRAYDLLLHGGGDLEVHAHVNWLFGALLKDRREFVPAIRFLERARDDYRELQQEHEVGIVLLTLSVLYRDIQDPSLALKTHIQAYGLLDEEKSPTLAVAAWNNLAHLLCDAARYEEAEEVLQQLPTIYENLVPNSPAQLNLTWMRGKIDHGLGRFSEAMEKYLYARRGYEQHGNLYRVAVISLDLLQLHYGKGDLDEVEKLAGSVYQALRKQPLEAEAFEALRILHSARTQRHLVRQALEQLALQLAQNPLPGHRSPISEL